MFSDQYCTIYDKVIVPNDQCYKGSISWENNANWDFSEYLYKLVICEGENSNCEEMADYYTPPIDKSVLDGLTNLVQDNTIIYIIPQRPVTDADCPVDPSSIDDYTEFNGFRYLSYDDCNPAPLPNTISHTSRGNQNYHKGSKGLGADIPTEGFAALDDIGGFSHNESRLKFSLTMSPSNRVSKSNCTFTQLPNPIPLVGDYPITYKLEKPSRLSIMVYDANGQIVSQLINEQIQQAGLHQISWSTSQLRGGVYFIVIKTDRETISKKLIKLN